MEVGPSRYIKNFKSITAVVLTVVMLVFVSCGKSNVKTNSQLNKTRDAIPVMQSENVVTLISDSGITQYKVNAGKWVIYDKLERPYWHFPAGLHLEKFDLDLNVVAEVDADSAIYYNQEERWILMGNVDAINEEGERFQSERLFLEQKNDRIYSDTVVTITQKDKIINGIGLESNQRLSKYTILNPTGIIPLDEEEEETQDSTAVETAEKEVPEL